MAVEDKQLKNVRNKIIDYIKTVPPQKLVEFAILCKIKIPENIINKYSRKGSE